MILLFFYIVVVYLKKGIFFGLLLLCVCVFCGSGRKEKDTVILILALPYGNEREHCLLPKNISMCVAAECCFIRRSLHINIGLAEVH